MQDTLSIIFFGWPAIIGSLLLTLIGMVAKRPAAVAVGAVLLLPFSILLTRTFLPAILLPLFDFGAAFALWRRRLWLAWLLLLPLILVTYWALRFVVTS